MICKTFEIRDEATFIPAMAIKLKPDCERDRYLLARAGYGRSQESQAEYIWLTSLSGGGSSSTSDPHEWVLSRTMTVAHKYIEEHFDKLASGEVIDVEFILGERVKPKQSEQEEYSEYGV